MIIRSDFYQVRNSYIEGPPVEPSLYVPPSHISFEIDHLYPEDYDIYTRKELAARFARCIRLADAVRKSWEDELGRELTVSACMLVDEYEKMALPPSEILTNRLLPAIDEAEEKTQSTGLTIDYLGREAGCAGYYHKERGYVDIARQVLGRLTPMAPFEHNAKSERTLARFPNWVVNGVPALLKENGMAAPPQQMTDNKHSIFIGSELYSEDKKGRRSYSCAFLASAWQLLRLDQLEYYEEPTVTPEPIPSSERLKGMLWSELPPVMRLRPDRSANPFAAFFLHNILPDTYRETETAVNVIHEQFVPDPKIVARLDDCADQAGIKLPYLTERRTYTTIPTFK